MNRRWLIPVAIIVGLILVIVLPLIGTYNSLVNKEEGVDTSFADLDAQLQRRFDLIPNLVNAVRATLEQEQEVFGQIARARQNYAGADTTDQRVEAADGLQSALARLLVIMENYPVLRSNDNVRDLQVQLEGTENRINQSRRDYNGVVRDYNISIRRFPRSILAGMFGFDRKALFEAPAGAREAPQVDLSDDDADTPAPETEDTPAPTG